MLNDNIENVTVHLIESKYVNMGSDLTILNHMSIDPPVQQPWTYEGDYSVSELSFDEESKEMDVVFVNDDSAGNNLDLQTYQIRRVVDASGLDRDLYDHTWSKQYPNLSIP